MAAQLRDLLQANGKSEKAAKQNADTVVDVLIFAKHDYHELQRGFVKR